MPQPYDYTLRNLPNPTENLINSLTLAQGISQLKSARQAADAQKQLQADLNQLGTNPTTAGLVQLMVRNPSISEHLKRTYDVLSAEQQQARINQASQVYAALEAGQTDVAQQLLQEQADAFRNSGMENEAKAAETMAKVAAASPTTAKTSAGLFLASAMGPEKFTETFTKLQSERREAALQPEQLTAAQAKARQAAVKADFAESEAVVDLQKKGWDIYKIQEDVKIARENNRIAALKAQTDREQNELKRQQLQLKLDEARLKRDQGLRTQAAELETARSGIDNSLNVIDRLVRNPELDNIIGAVEGSTFYPSTLVGLVSPFSDADKRADAMADLETIQSQAFLNNLMEAKSKGATFGSLTEREGERLVGYVRNLKTKQSEQQFRSNLNEIQRLLLKSRKTLADKYGVPESIPDTPEAQPTTEEIDALVRQYSGVK